MWRRLTLLADGHQAVHLVGLRDVQLGSFHHLRKLWTLVEGAAQTRLPGRRVVLNPVGQLPFELCPRLQRTEDFYQNVHLGFASDILSYVDAFGKYVRSASWPWKWRRPRPYGSPASLRVSTGCGTWSWPRRPTPDPDISRCWPATAKNTQRLSLISSLKFLCAVSCLADSVQGWHDQQTSSHVTYV